MMLLVRGVSRGCGSELGSGHSGFFAADFGRTGECKLRVRDAVR